jgi:hypothetical protein
VQRRKGYSVSGTRRSAPREHPTFSFLKARWLMSYNKLATVDNLNKKGLKKKNQRRFCGENESIAYLRSFLFPGLRDGSLAAGNAFRFL